MNIRIDASGKAIEEGNQVQIGGNESYMSSCMLHFRLENKTFSQEEKPLEIPCKQN
jgi:thymidine kinase